MPLSKEVRAVLAEFVAMTLFVYVGCGTAVSSQSMLGFSPGTTNENTFLTAVALAFGIGIAVLAYGIAPISGGHINPAVTAAFVAIGKHDPLQAAMYMVAQFAGGMAGAYLLWGSTNAQILEEDDAPPFLLGANFVQPDLPVESAFLIEFMGTFLLVWTVMMTAAHKKSIAGNIAPIAIGWSVLLAHLVLVPFTGCGINPARSFGPHIVIILAGQKVGDHWWVYYTAPFAGAVVAAWVTYFIFGLDEDDEEETQTIQEIKSQELKPNKTEVEPLSKEDEVF